MTLLDLVLAGVDRAGLDIDEHPALVGGAAAVFDRTRTYRYVLIRHWGPGPAAVVVMLNPSTATAIEDDHTIRRCLHFARQAGCGALVVVNLFALCATDPDALLHHADPAGELNEQVLAGAAALSARTPVGLVLAAWGASSPLVAGQDETVLGILTRAGLDVLCLGVTAGGSPRHPSRVGNDTELRLLQAAPRPWRALSVWRPWANLLFAGKPVENRGWQTAYRGRLLIHAGKRWDERGPDLAIRQGVLVTPDEPGGYLGLVDLVDVHLGVRCCAPWGEPRTYHWRMESPLLFTAPIAGPGKQGLYRAVPEAVTELIGAAQ